MSTPTGKSLHPTNVHETWESARPERQNTKDNNDPLRSSDLPTRAHDRDVGTWDPAENERHRSPYAPKRGRTQTTVEAGFIKSEDAPSLAPPHAPEDSRENSA